MGALRIDGFGADGGATPPASTNLMKKGLYNKQRTITSRENYMWGLAKSVGDACETWLEGRGLKTQGWRQQKSNRKKQFKDEKK